MRNGASVIIVGALGPSHLGLLISQAKQDLQRVGDLINEVDWLITSCPPYLRPLVDDGFRARMGIGLRDWERMTETLLESARFLEHARVDQDHESFMRCAENFLADSSGAMSSLRKILNGVSALPEEASALSPEDKNEEVEKLALRQAEAVGDLLTSLEMLSRLLSRGKDLIS